MTVSPSDFSESQFLRTGISSAQHTHREVKMDLHLERADVVDRSLDLSLADQLQLEVLH